MHTISQFALILITMITCLVVPLSAADTGAKVATITGQIDRLDGDNSRVIVKTIAADPSKVRTAVITVDKTSTITIDKIAATYDDLKVGDQVMAKYCQGVATTFVVTRAPPAKTATPAAKP